jgi:hypothetical protein
LAGTRYAKHEDLRGHSLVKHPTRQAGVGDAARCASHGGGEKGGSQGGGEPAGRRRVDEDEAHGRIEEGIGTDHPATTKLE